MGVHTRGGLVYRKKKPKKIKKIVSDKRKSPTKPKIIKTKKKASKNG